jgi:hypothetical protein
MVLLISVVAAPIDSERSDFMTGYESTIFTSARRLWVVTIVGADRIFTSESLRALLKTIFNAKFLMVPFTENGSGAAEFILENVSLIFVQGGKTVSDPPAISSCALFD